MVGLRGGAPALALLILCTLAAPARAGEPDRALDESHHFTLRASGGGYVLDEEVEVIYALLTERATRVREYSVYAPFFAPVEDLRASLGRDRLRGDDIREAVPVWEDVFLSGGRYHVVTLPRAPAVGETLTYSYRSRYSDVAYAPLLYVPAGDRLARYEVVVEHPDDVTVDFGFFFPRSPVPYAVATPARGRTVLTFGNLDALADLPLFAFNGLHAVVQLRFTGPGGAPVNPVTATDFAAWYGRLARAGAGGSGALAALAQSLRRETPEATVAALHDHVRGTIRYVADERGEHAFVPRAPEVVLQRTYGDCKDRAFLVAALAAQLGLRVDVVLVSTEPEAAFEGGTHVGLFNHVINAFDAGDGRRVYFDPTHPYVPYGDLPEGDVEGQALLLGAGGAELLRVPAPDGPPALDVTVRAALDGSEGEAEVTLRGGFLAAYRHAQDKGAGLDVENVLSNLTSGYLHKLRLHDFAPAADSGAAVTFRATADLSEFVVASPTRRYLPQTPFRTVPAEAVERAADAFPLHLGERPHLRLVLDLDPGTWEVEPGAFGLGDDTGPAAFSADLALAEGRARVTYRFRQRRKRLAGDARDAYLGFARGYLDARRNMFIFRQPDAATGG